MLISRSVTDEVTGVNASVDFELRIDACAIKSIVYSNDTIDEDIKRKLLVKCMNALTSVLPCSPLVWEISIAAENKKYFNILKRIGFKQHFCTLFELSSNKYRFDERGIDNLRITLKILHDYVDRMIKCEKHNHATTVPRR